MLKVYESTLRNAPVLKTIDRAARYIGFAFGPRCPDFDGECPTCKAWAAFDAWVGQGCKGDGPAWEGHDMQTMQRDRARWARIS